MSIVSTDLGGSVGEEVRALLARRRVSQEQLGAAIGVSGASISRKVRGLSDFTVGELLAVAAFLDVPAGSLLPAAVTAA